jgi:predicted nucleotidyltransferase
VSPCYNSPAVLKENFDILIAALQNAVFDFYGNNLVTLAIFGSVARGAMRPDSDLDIFICAQNLPQGRRARLKDFLILENTLETLQRSLRKESYNIALSPVIKTPQELSCGGLIFIDMTEHVRILYDKNDMLKKYLAGLKQKMIQLGSRKIQLGNAWYWDLIPDYKKVREVTF